MKVEKTIKKTFCIRKLKEMKKLLKLLKKTLKIGNEELIKEIVEFEIEEIIKLLDNFNSVKIY